MLEPGADARFAIGRLQLEGLLERSEGELRIHSGRAEGSELTLRGLRFSRAEGRFAYAAGRVGVERLVLDGYDGAVSFEGSLRPGRPGRIEGELRATDLDLAGLVADWRGRPLDRPLGSLDLGGTVALFLRATDRGTGRGELAIRGGELPAGSLFAALLGSIGRLTGQVISLGGQVAPSPSRVERVTASVTLRDDRLHTENLEIVTDDYRYAASGSLGLDRTVAFSGRLQLSNRGAQRMVASAALPLGGSGGLVPEIPVDGREVSASRASRPARARSPRRDLGAHRSRQ